jgi:hypothetical protein
MMEKTYERIKFKCVMTTYTLFLIVGFSFVMLVYYRNSESAGGLEGRIPEEGGARASPRLHRRGRDSGQLIRVKTIFKNVFPLGWRKESVHRETFSSL